MHYSCTFFTPLCVLPQLLSLVCKNYKPKSRNRWWYLTQKKFFFKIKSTRFIIYYKIYFFLLQMHVLLIRIGTYFWNRTLYYLYTILLKKSSGKYEIWHVYQNKIELVQYFLFFGVRRIETIFFFQNNSWKNPFCKYFLQFFWKIQLAVKYTSVKMRQKLTRSHMQISTLSLMQH